MMKKIVAFILVLAMAMSMMACGNGGASGDYSELIEMLDNGEYEAAKVYIDGLAQNAKDDANKKDEPEEEETSLVSEVYGEWTQVYHDPEGDDLEKIQINEDGTCVLGEKSYLWEVRDEQETHLYLDVNEGKKKVYSLEMSKSDLGDCSLSYWEVDGEGNSISDGWDYINKAKYDYVEITMENVMDYFEWTEPEDRFSENSFGEAISFSRYQYFQMKSEALEKLYKVEKDLAVEMSYTNGRISANVDFENRTCSLDDDFVKTGEERATNVYNAYWNSEDGYMFSFENGWYSDYEKTLESCKEDIEIERVLGAFYFRK